MPTTSVTMGVDPAQWLPRAVYYYDAGPHDLVSVLSTDLTWPELVRARDTCCYDFERAVKRGWHRATRQHLARLRRLERVLEMFAPVMKNNPTLPFGEACAQFSRQALKVTKEL